MGALYKGFIVTAITSLLIMYPVIDLTACQKNIPIMLVPIFGIRSICLWNCRISDHRFLIWVLNIILAQTIGQSKQWQNHLLQDMVLMLFKV